MTPRSRPVHRLVAGAVAATVLLVAAPSASVSEAVPAPSPLPGAEREELTVARQQISAVARQLRRAETSAVQAEQALQRADRQLAVLEAAVNAAAAAVDRQSAAVDRAAKRHAALRREVRRLREVLQRRAAELYKQGATLPFELLVASGDVQGAIDRSAYLHVITETDQANLEAAANARTALASQRRILEDERRYLLAMQREQEVLLAEALALRESRALAAASARAEVKALAERKDDLVAEAETLKELIRAARFAPVQHVQPSHAGLVWPMCDPVTSEFGRRWGRLHAGIDVGAPVGTPIGAARAGVVLFAGWQGGYGRLTLLDHGGGLVTAYAHQSQQYVAAGEQVVRGQRIGDVGSTGRSTGPHLHFETRVNGEPVNPRRYLSGGC